MVRTLSALASGGAHETPQPDDGVTYARKIDKAEARIDWSRPAEDLGSRVRGLSPFPGAWCVIGGERVKVLMAGPEEGSGAPGEVLDDALLVACGTGALRLASLQRSGKGAMDAATFLNGFPVRKGSRLG
jgi:methionyl-tRNA formyltransferase